MKTQTRTILRYHGGKYRLAPWLISHFPAHRIYVEPYCGAASVLMQKPRVYSEVINDLDGEIVNLFRVLRDPSQARELERILRLTPYARTEFEAAYLSAPDPIETARRLIIRSFMGFGSAACNAEHQTGFRSNSDRSGTTPAHDWRHYPDHLLEFSRRLQGVVIENRAAIDVIAQHDTPQALHYVDPPYPLSTRPSAVTRREQCYRYEMSDDQHRELAHVLYAVKGMVFLSGYACHLYDLELYPDWKRTERVALADGARKRTEVLWMNAAAAASLQGRLELVP
jgi:DNA adenine methylase